MNSIKSLYYPLVIFMVFILQACSSLLPSEKPTKVPELASIEPNVVESSKLLDAKWWEVFGDTQLNHFITLGIQNSPSLQIANERVKVAQALLSSSRSVLLPQVGITGQANQQKFSENYIFIPGVMDRITSYGFVAGTFSWSLDVWGKNEKLFEAAKYRLQGALIDGELNRLNLQVAIVAAYAEYDIALKNRDLLLRNTQIQRELLQIYKARLEKGLVDQMTISQVGAELDKAVAQLAIAQSVVGMYANQIAILTGNPPSWVSQIQPPKLQFNNQIALDHQKIPSDLIARRADLQALLSQVQASGIDYSAAKLDYLPSFDLQANIGYQSFGLDRLISSSSQMFSIGPVLNLPIFNGGRIEANVAAKKATNQEAIARYHEALLQALQQAADGISKVRFTSEQVQSQTQATGKATFIFEQLVARKKSGLLSDEQLLQNELLVNAQKQLLEQTKLNAESAYLYLILSLGGGFHTATSKLPSASN